jgi:hypothetical protein
MNIMTTSNTIVSLPSVTIAHTVIDAIIQDNKRLEVKNDSYADALELTEEMLFHTHRKINILTGGACGGFYATLLEHLTSALERIRKAGGSARMIVLAPKYPEWLLVLAQEFVGTFELARLNASNPLQHFIVCDSRIVREENIHEELRPDSPADTIKAAVIFNEPEKGSALEVKFDELWKTSEVNRVDATNQPTAPSWLIQRMEVLRQQPPPTSEQVDTQLTASAALRKTLNVKVPV